jgi:hypothetical protein
VIFRRLALALAAAAVLATCASVAIIALALALYALVLPLVTPAGAAAIVAAAAAVMIGIAGLALSRRPRPKRVAVGAERSGSVVERAMSLVQEKPLVAIAAALGVGFLVIRNPRYLGAAARAFVEGRENPPPGL